MIKLMSLTLQEGRREIYKEIRKERKLRLECRALRLRPVVGAM